MYIYIVLVASYPLFAGIKHEERCNWCQDEPLRGMLWKCARCYDYNLCTSCYMRGAHTLEHEFIRTIAHDSPNK